MVEQLVPGKIYRVSKQATTRCCSCILRLGEFVKVERQTSPNRVLIGHQTDEFQIGQDGSGWHGHKVRKSTLRMSVEEFVEGS